MTTVSHNTATFNREDGFDIDNSDKVLFLSNTASNNGQEGFDEDCDDVPTNGTGSTADFCDNTYRNNKSFNNDRDGMEWSGEGGGTPSVKIEGNKVMGNGYDGIDINRESSSGFTVTKNKVLKNQGTGIENEADNTTMTNNTVKKNQTDIAGEGDDAATPGTGSVGTFSGNNFDTGGATITTPATGNN